MTEFPFETVIFDLDGTLIDSAPSILASFDSALKKAGLRALVPLDDSLIGPPLRQTLVKLTGVAEDAVLDNLVAFFKESYDSQGYLATCVYHGVEELLAYLAENGVPMAIATNKRKTPTEKIIRLLGWERYFKVVASLDSAVPAHANKAAVIGAVLKEMALEVSTAVYVGDKAEDGEAAELNGMPFIAAGWGYGEWNAAVIPAGWNLLPSPDRLMTLGAVASS